MTRIEENLLEWDGKSKAKIEAIFAAHKNVPDFLANLLDTLPNPNMQAAATWLIKHGLEKKVFHLEPSDQSKILTALPALQDWPAKLHILQIIESFDLSAASHSTVERFLRNCMEDENKFVRAWSYNGFHYLAKHRSELRGEALSILNQAMEEETASSVLSRVRRKLKERF